LPWSICDLLNLNTVIPLRTTLTYTFIKDSTYLTCKSKLAYN
jgi:hypothetical protein